MNKMLIKLLLLMVLFPTQTSHAGGGPLFSVALSGNTLQIRSTLAHNYPAAGIRINTAGYTIANIGTDCSLHSNGYCLFAVNNSVAKSITLNGPSGAISITLCLNGQGPLSCQNYTVGIQYTVGGVLTGLTSGSVVLQNNASNNLTLSSNGPFTFSTPVASGQPYSISVETQPPFQRCTVTNGTGIMGTSSVTNVVVNCRPLMSYVANFNPANPASKISLCPINPDGSFAVCTQLIDGAFNQPSAITLNRARTKAYITNFGGSVAICNVDPNGDLSACSVQIGYVFNQPIGVALSANESTAFVANAGNNSVDACPINQVTGAFQGPCVPTGGFTRPNGIVLNNSGTIAYITNFNNNTVSSCLVLNNSSLGACAATASIFNSPLGVALNSSGTRAYIVNNGNNQVSVCDIDNSGALINCNPYFDATFSAPTGIALDSSGTIAYVGNFNLNQVSRCQLAVNGTFINCVPELDGSFVQPFGVFVTN